MGAGPADPYFWWDGKLIGEVKLPYSSVDLGFVNPTDGEHTLAIAVDNRLSSVTAPLFKPNYDFYAYGGIYRNVSIQALPTRMGRRRTKFPCLPIFLDRIHFSESQRAAVPAASARHVYFGISSVIKMIKARGGIFAF